MNQEQVASTDTFIKSPPNFDTIPEDVALSIVELIQSWAIEEGDEEQREKGRKARDSTLRAAALTSSKIFKHLSAAARHLGYDTHLLILSGVGKRRASSREERSKLFRALGKSFSTLPATATFTERFWQGVVVAIRRCYGQLSNLQNLVILDSAVCFHQFFHHKVGQQAKPLSFLSGSLKRLFIQLWDDGLAGVNYNLNARNATWLLVFCRQIEEASLACEMSVEDSEYLSEYAETFVGLSSVKRLAIQIEFTYSEADKRTWWGVPEEQNRNYKGGSRKTESIFNFFQSTNQLYALEIHVPFSDVREGDDSEVSHNCLSTLSRSFNSLKHLRLMGGMLGLETASVWLSYSFKALRVLTLDYRVLLALSGTDLPESLEMIYLPFYLVFFSTTSEEPEGNYREESLLRSMMDAKGHNLKEVVVPSRPIGADCKRTVSPQETQLWAQARRELERANSITSGKVRLRTVEVGEIVGDESNGEVFMSTLRWISPP